MADADRRTLWSPWSLLLAGAFAALSLASLSVLAALPSQADTATKVLLLSMGVVGLAVGIRIPLRRVIVREGDVSRVGWFKRTPLSIRSVTTGPGGSGLLSKILDVSLPVVTTSAGKRVELDGLWGFGSTNSRIERTVEVLRKAAARQIQAPPRPFLSTASTASSD